MEICTFTRPLLESTIRQHLLELPNVEILEGYEAHGLAGDQGRVTGLRIQPRNRTEGTEVITLDADLVVDTSGRPSSAPEWLKEIGCEAPDETVVDAFWGYATRIYEIPENFQADWKVIAILNRPPYQPRAGIIQPIEGNRWIVTLAGVMHDYPPTDEDGFLQFARSLSSPELYRAIQKARPLSKISGYRRTENRLRSFEKARLPQGFAALGDSVCAFNPVYGLGMTLTGLEALALRKNLKQGRGELNTRRFQQQVAKLVAGPWALATGEDLRWPTTEGGKITAKVKFMHWYLEHVIRLIPRSEVVFRRFQEVNHMLKSPAALFHPSVLGPVLQQAFGPRRVVARPKEAPVRVPAATTTSTVPIHR